uniref:Uncharacterized protein n=1 Tax=Rhizophora mucronata TaxID=61149 RepID=A0A2P2R1K3_RHIMU
MLEVVKCCFNYLSYCT